MKILQIHNLYQQRGGEDIAAENEAALLVANGHKVARYLVSNDVIRGLRQRALAALSLAWSKRSKVAVAGEIERWQPDIVHVHNTFPLLTASIYDACAEAGVPVVQTLHNFRIACGGALFLRNGKICEKCLHGTPYWGAWHRCYRGSLAGSLAAAHATAYHRDNNTWNEKIARFIVLTQFARAKFIEAGIAPQRISVKPNFAWGSLDAPPPLDRAARGGALFVGRLSTEKGLHILMEAWRNVPYPLVIAGDGPLGPELRRKAPAHITFTGALAPAEIRRLMASAAFLVMPSICYEGFPMTMVEAYASGLPILGSAIGSVGELIEDGVTGRLVSPGNADALASAARDFAANPRAVERMGQAARARYEAEFAPETNYRALMAIYKGAMHV